MNIHNNINATVKLDIQVLPPADLCNVVIDIPACEQYPPRHPLINKPTPCAVISLFILILRFNK